MEGETGRMGNGGVWDDSDSVSTDIKHGQLR
jgi:hypothetical protein